MSLFPRLCLCVSESLSLWVSVSVSLSVWVYFWLSYSLALSVNDDGSYSYPDRFEIHNRVSDSFQHHLILQQPLLLKSSHPGSVCAKCVFVYSYIIWFLTWSVECHEWISICFARIHKTQTKLAGISPLCPDKSCFWSLHSRLCWGVKPYSKIKKKTVTFHRLKRPFCIWNLSLQEECQKKNERKER